jgi:predicted transcriptional regulator
MSVLPKISERESKALSALVDQYEDHYACFATIASDANIELSCVRRTVRSLARKGLAEYAKGLWTEDGAPAGSGYRATRLGRDLAATLSPAVCEGK